MKAGMRSWGSRSQRIPTGFRLIRRLKEAAGQARMDIVVNFEDLKLPAPNALTALGDSDAMKVAIPNVRIRFHKFKDAFEVSLEGFFRAGWQGVSLAGLEHLNEDLQDA